MTPVPTLIELPKKSDPRGNLTFVQTSSHLPFTDLKRVFYIYDIPTGESRGSHAHRNCHQILICLSGSFDVKWNNGTKHGRVHLNRPWRALHIPPMIWASEVEFDPHSVCLVLTSHDYDEADYIRDYDEFIALINSRVA